MKETEVRLVDRSFQFAELGPRRFEYNGHGHARSRLGREKGGIQGDVMDAAAGEIELCELIVIQSFDRRSSQTP